MINGTTDAHYVKCVYIILLSCATCGASKQFQNRPYLIDATHYAIASYCLIYFQHMTGKRVVSSTAISIGNRLVKRGIRGKLGSEIGDWLTKLYKQ